MDAPCRCTLACGRTGFRTGCGLPKLVRLLLPLLAGLGALSPAAAGEIVILVDKASQRMSVSVGGEQRYTWPVSTGMSGYATPTGRFAALWLSRHHRSREWDDAPMPYSIFFTDSGHAIHGSQAVGRLGSPASHGCVRLSPANAGILFRLVQEAGAANTRIEVTGTDPIGTGFAAGGAGARDLRGLTAFDPLATGIMAGSSPRRPQR